TGTYGNIPLQQAQSQGKLYLDKALQLDSELAEAWAGMGLYNIGLPTGGLQPGIEALRKALALNPGLIDASNWLHNALMAAGKPAQARQVVMGMIERDPLYRPGIRNAVNAYLSFGEPDKALSMLKRIQPLIPNDAVIQSSQAAVLLSMGQTAEGLKLVESAVALQPTNSTARLTLNSAWMDSHQYEQVAQDGEDFLPVIALTYLGRTEEAAILAHKRAEEIADIGTLFNFLNITDRSDELIAYLEERWPDLDSVQEEFPPYGALGYFLMIDVALAYSRTGNEGRFADAMQRVRTAHDRLIADGVSNNNFFFAQAAYLALAGNRDSSLDYLERAVDGGGILNMRMAFDWPELEPLEGDPRYEAIQARMISHVNSERQKLGLEPAKI
ncbi:MAG: tetratricopeptide repeat protein, partial [Lysobacterales bacterium]